VGVPDEEPLLLELELELLPLTVPLELPLLELHEVYTPLLPLQGSEEEQLPPAARLQ
jgi:hypothetical protein